MSALPLLAALLAEALPGLTLRDWSLPAGDLLPWLPSVRAGIADPAALEPGERALLAGFRQRGEPLLGLDPIADAAADPAWEAAERLVWGAEGEPGALVLLRGRAGPLPEEIARIKLILGVRTAPESFELLLPAARLPALFERLRASAHSLAGPGWEAGGRALTPRLASLGLLAPIGAPLPVGRPDPVGLPQDLPEPAVLGGQARARLLLGALPAGTRLRLRFAGAEPGPVALLLDGLRQPTTAEAGGWLAARTASGSGQAAVLGLAWPGNAPAGLRLASIEVGG
ncbi:hypothetical protein JMJ55_16070 [Belnapia sp. T6]|uniref:Uncharacterized protein n=1 Tax=Belnapia mucosa TaxID=2804532 RepID=A0ABS1V580_9PROT|nr:hypothetical protein [Belnapia mucosa]MBL6456855.1 hypothetical protein [Belnapia mucosa]